MDTRATTAWFNVFNWSPLDPSWEQRRKATWAWRKFKKARRWAYVLRSAPFVRMIAIGNSLGYGNCSSESDIDLVIVTAPKRIWTVRLFVVALLRLFRQRPGEHTRDAICPSFFLTTEALDLEELQLPPARNPSQPPSPSRSRAGGLTLRGGTPECALPDDPYLLFWVTQLTVLYDEVGTYDAFWRANEQRVRHWLPDARLRAIHPRLLVSPPPVGRGSVRGRDSRVVEQFLHGRFGDTFEAWARRFQERRFSPEIRALALAHRSIGEGGNRDSRVVITDRMLKFHTNDRRQEYRDRWLERLRTV